MTRQEEFKKMIEAIENADYWDAFPEYWKKLCDWYEIDPTDTEKYAEPEDAFRAVVDAYEKEAV